MEGILYWPGVGDRGGIRLGPSNRLRRLDLRAGWVGVNGRHRQHSSPGQ